MSLPLRFRDDMRWDETSDTLWLRLSLMFKTLAEKEEAERDAHEGNINSFVMKAFSETQSGFRVLSKKRIKDYKQRVYSALFELGIELVEKKGNPSNKLIRDEIKLEMMTFGDACRVVMAYDLAKTYFIEPRDYYEYELGGAHHLRNYTLSALKRANKRFFHPMKPFPLDDFEETSFLLSKSLQGIINRDSDDLDLDGLLDITPTNIIDMGALEIVMKDSKPQSKRLIQRALLQLGAFMTKQYQMIDNTGADAFLKVIHHFGADTARFQGDNMDEELTSLFFVWYKEQLSKTIVECNLEDEERSRKATAAFVNFIAQCVLLITCGYYKFMSLYTIVDTLMYQLLNGTIYELMVNKPLIRITTNEPMTIPLSMRSKTNTTVTIESMELSQISLTQNGFFSLRYPEQRKESLQAVVPMRKKSKPKEVKSGHVLDYTKTLYEFSHIVKRSDLGKVTTVAPNKYPNKNEDLITMRTDESRGFKDRSLRMFSYEIVRSHYVVFVGGEWYFTFSNPFKFFSEDYRKIPKDELYGILKKVQNLKVNDPYPVFERIGLYLETPDAWQSRFTRGFDTNDDQGSVNDDLFSNLREEDDDPVINAPDPPASKPESAEVADLQQQTNAINTKLQSMKDAFTARTSWSVREMNEFAVEYAKVLEPDEGRLSWMKQDYFDDIIDVFYDYVTLSKGNVKYVLEALDVDDSVAEGILSTMSETMTPSDLRTVILKETNSKSEKYGLFKRLVGNKAIGEQALEEIQNQKDSLIQKQTELMEKHTKSLRKALLKKKTLKSGETAVVDKHIAQTRNSIEKARNALEELNDPGWIEINSVMSKISGAEKLKDSKKLSIAMSKDGFIEMLEYFSSKETTDEELAVLVNLSKYILTELKGKSNEDIFRALSTLCTVETASKREDKMNDIIGDSLKTSWFTKGRVRNFDYYITALVAVYYTVRTDVYSKVPGFHAACTSDRLNGIPLALRYDLFLHGAGALNETTFETKNWKDLYPTKKGTKKQTLYVHMFEGVDTTGLYEKVRASAESEAGDFLQWYQKLLDAVLEDRDQKNHEKVQQILDTDPREFGGLLKSIVEYEPKTKTKPKTKPKTKTKTKPKTKTKTKPRSKVKKPSATFKKELNKLGYQLKENPGGGDCFFYAIRDALDADTDVQQLREEIVEYLNPDNPDNILGKTIPGGMLLFDLRSEGDIDTDEESYFSQMKMKGTWADLRVVYATAVYLKRCISVYRLTGSVIDQDAQLFQVPEDWGVEFDQNASYVTIANYENIHYVAIETLNTVPKVFDTKPGEIPIQQGNTCAMHAVNNLIGTSYNPKTFKAAARTRRKTAWSTRDIDEVLKYTPNIFAERNQLRARRLEPVTTYGFHGYLLRIDDAWHFTSVRKWSDKYTYMDSLSGSREFDSETDMLAYVNSLDWNCVWFVFRSADDKNVFKGSEWRVLKTRPKKPIVVSEKPVVKDKVSDEVKDKVSDEVKDYYKRIGKAVQWEDPKKRDKYVQKYKKYKLSAGETDMLKEYLVYLEGIGRQDTADKVRGMDFKQQRQRIERYAKNKLTPEEENRLAEISKKRKFAEIDWTKISLEVKRKALKKYKKK